MHHASISSTTGCTIQNLWVKELIILVFIYCSHVRLNVHYQITEKQFIARQMLYLERLASEDVILQLINSTCISSLLYDVDACALTKSVNV